MSSFCLCGVDNASHGAPPPVKSVLFATSPCAVSYARLSSNAAFIAWSFRSIVLASAHRTMNVAGLLARGSAWEVEEVSPDHFCIHIIKDFFFLGSSSMRCFLDTRNE